MNLIELFKRIKPYVYPYRWLVIVTLILTLIGSLMAQVNAIVLDRTVDAINALVNPEGFAWSKAARILTIITIVLLGKEILSAGITFAQNFFGEKMRINVSKDLSQAVIDRMLTYTRAGIPKVRFHDLRHTFATIALQNGVDIKTVSGMLGHFPAGFTLDTYAHVTTSAQKEAAQILGNILNI